MAPPNPRATENHEDVFPIAQTDAFRALRQAILIVAMPLGMAASAASSFLMPGLGSVLSLAIMQAVAAAAGAAGRPARRALVADLTGGDQRGRAYGIYVLASGLGATVGPLAGGWLYEHVSPAAPFYANGIVVAASALVLWAWLQVPAIQPTEEEIG
jgi:MFS family permease